MTWVSATRGRTSVEEVLREVGLGRGTFYKYFDGKAALLATLSEDCAVRLEVMVEDLGVAIVGDDPAGALRIWLHEWVSFHRRYRSVFRAWTEQDPGNGAVNELGVRTAESILLAFEDALALVDRDDPFDIRVGSLVLLAMFERVPDYAFGTRHDMSDEQIVEVLAGVSSEGCSASNRHSEAEQNCSAVS